MSVRRGVSTRPRVLSHRFAVPLGTDAFEYDDDIEVGDEGDFDDDDDDTPSKRKKKKKKKKKRRKNRKGKNRQRRRKNKKRRRKRKGKRKKNRDERDDSKRVNTPKSFDVVKQTIRTKRDGSQVVDLTVDVDKIGRADKYEFRVVKKDNGKVSLVTG